MSLSISIFLTVATILLGIFYWVRKQKHNVFKARGIPGPEPNWLKGNFRFKPSKQLFEQLRYWTQKYGKTYGYYEGPTPILVSSDPEVCKQVLVKKFSKFHSRKLFPVQPDPDSDHGIHMFTASGGKWKRLRTISNPTFSSSKMKRMYPLINNRVKCLNDRLNEVCKKGESFNILEFFQCMTLEVICECAFGIQIDCQKDPQNPLLLNARHLFLELAMRPFFIMLPAILPILRAPTMQLVKLASHLRTDPSYYIVDTAEKVIQMRKNSDQPFYNKDLLQLMLEAESIGKLESDWETESASETEEEKKSDNNNNNNNCQDLNNNSVKPKENGHWSSHAEHRVVKKLTNDEIKWQSLLFLIAGYETTSSTLGYLSYELALNPEVQKKLQQEIDANIPDNEEPDYETIHNLQYLDQVWCETLRKYPLAALVVNRTCTEPCVIDGIDIPVGMVFQPDIWSLHNDPEHWGPEDPKEFVPERFSPERKEDRHPMTYIPFGGGPRNCIGMRFAIMEGKLAVCEILKKFNIVRCEKTEVPLQLIDAGAIQPKNGKIFVKLEARQK